MKKVKKITILYILIASLLVVFNLFGLTTMDRVYAEGVSGLDETTATVKVNYNGETTYYESFGDAVDNMSSKSTIVLLKDASMGSFSNKNFSIDLNGKTLSSEVTISYTTLTFLDSVGSGKVTGTMTFYSSNLSIISAGSIDSIILTDRSKCTISGGKINNLYANGSSLSVNGGEINRLCIYNRGISLSGGTINDFSFSGSAPFFDILEEGYIYTNKADNSPIKVEDMTSSTQATIIKCTHTAFTDNVCDYCGYICDHNGQYDADGVCQVCGYVCNHENHLINGVCEICNYVCPHSELNDSNVCLKCNLQMVANVKNSSTNKNYAKIDEAVSALVDGDTLTLCKTIKISNSLAINASCTIDLNGYSFSGVYVELNNKIIVTDSKGSGSMAITSTSASSQIEVRGSETTEFLIMLNASRLKYYSGKLLMINIYSGTIDNILPSGYIYVKHDGESTQKLTKQDTNVSRFYTDNCYLTSEICEHDSVKEDFSCVYCGNTLSQEQILKTLAKDLQTTKDELSEAIMKKEDVSSINEKVKTLNDTISSTEIICKSYSDEKDAQLKAQLEALIATAKQEAINSSNEALELAKTGLQNAINGKVDIETYNAKVEELTKAIDNAEKASKEYADKKDLELKDELIKKINDSKNALQEANAEMLERLSKAETQIDSNAKDINSLKTALIILSILFVAILSAGFVLLYPFVKKNYKKTA